MEEKSAEFVQILWAPGALATLNVGTRLLEPRSRAGRYHTAIGLRCWLLNLQSRAPSYLDPTEIEDYCVVLNK